MAKKRTRRAPARKRKSIKGTSKKRKAPTKRRSVKRKSIRGTAKRRSTRKKSLKGLPAGSMLVGGAVVAFGATHAILRATMDPSVGADGKPTTESLVYQMSPLLGAGVGMLSMLGASMYKKSYKSQAMTGALAAGLAGAAVFAQEKIQEAQISSAMASNGAGVAGLGNVIVPEYSRRRGIAGTATTLRRLEGNQPAGQTVALRGNLQPEAFGVAHNV